ncbi:MAG: hypothetical protein JNK40_12855 [Chromatiales bacterium]|nr:hypothetical protein [Chromatiales bacterium]
MIFPAHAIPGLRILVLLACLSLCGVSARAALPVIITIDTETSSGCTPAGCFPDPLSGRVYGVLDGRAYGIGMIMDLLEKRGLRGTFFVNAYLDSWYPEQEVAEMVASIIRRGHDVQFHAHAEFRCFRRCGPQDMDCRFRCSRSEGRTAGTSLENQIEVLREGALNIERWSGRYPVAYRGGALQADVNTLKALKALDIKIDSSLAGPGHPLAAVLPVNQLGVHEGVLEVPLLAYEENLVLSRRLRFLDQESAILGEQRHLLEQAADMGLGAVTLLMHSFSFCDPRVACPIEANIERFDALLDYLVGRQDRFRVMTMRDFWEAYEKDPRAYLLAPPARLPEVGYGLTLYRSVVRFNQGWMNVAFLLGNVVAALLLLATLFWGARRLRRRQQAS